MKIDRRRFCSATGGALATLCLPGWSVSEVPSALQAVSMRQLADDADSNLILSRIGTIHGFVSDDAGDVIALANTSSVSNCTLDDLTVCLRHHFLPAQSENERAALGCSIDPIRESEDPWAIQKVSVFGMPPAPMGARFVAVDAKMKRAAAGLEGWGDTRTSVFRHSRNDMVRCDYRGKANRSREHRFWFSADVQGGQRYERSDRGCIIHRPVNVKIQTERQYFDEKGGRHTQAADAGAEHFASAATKSLHEVAPRIVYDYRLIEFAALIAYLDIPIDAFSRLATRAIESVPDIPSYIGGIRRNESGDMVCGSTLTEKRKANSISVQLEQDVRRYQLSYRGGVDGSIGIVRDEFRETSGSVDLLADKVLAARPGRSSTVWMVV